MTEKPRKGQEAKQTVRSTELQRPISSRLIQILPPLRRIIKPPPEGESLATEQRALTQEEKEIKDYFFQSFRFSQGSPKIQDYMMKWMRAG